MRIQDNPHLPADSPLSRQLAQLHREVSAQVNALSEGLMVARYNALTAAPTTGTHARGDFIVNSAPSVLGTAGSQYCIDGWRCVAGGEPGTWVESRSLTGT